MKMYTALVREEGRYYFISVVGVGVTQSRKIDGKEGIGLMVSDLIDIMEPGVGTFDVEVIYEDDVPDATD